MLEAVLEQGVVLKTVLEAVKELVQEANLECDSEGMLLQAMDPAHVSLVKLRLSEGGFTQYRCDRHRALGFSMSYLAKVFKAVGKEDSVTITAPDDSDSVNFHFVSKDGEREQDVSMKLMDIEADSLSVPEQDYKSVVRLPAAEFARVIRDVSIFGEAVSISVSKSGVKFSASGDMGKSTIHLKAGGATADGNDSGVKVEVAKEPITLTFALKYLSSFAKAAGLSDEVALSMCADNPLSVEFPIVGFGSLRFFLAPKIDDDEATGDADADGDE